MNQPPLAAETLAKLTRVSTATLATQLFRRGLRQQFLVGVPPLGDVEARWAGEAFTMRFIPSREDLDTLESLHTEDNLQWQAVEQIGPGQVLVVDSRNDISAASAGDMLVTRAWKRGAVAFVTDGAVRDGSVLRELDIPTYARAITATTRLTSFHVADLQVPIGCSDVAVYPGDIMVGDADGVIVVPRGLADEIAGPAVEQEEIEDYLHTRVHTGESLLGIYPATDQSRRDYDDWKASR
ncbi:regulator of RNase E activity RraA [Kribbella aluminosa]|uniref:Putative 4-hydroxy-4-methyl-2-oxoglutarate aldolase n=1 Tax=Kribbella aluminosa TaxID=416017 RepID=A0ABS4UJ40_9ACTN|nr:ribonuclease activity regulator RraA [Kribbella aluminosa]MBP2351666.1 regulator of RNase E activity RraA [Kribbella aluminosa]